ncbi:hypothetical protein ASE31_28715 [Acidovorax sp. Root217]|nr:hypothetical protein ASE31_28715 [Acidovorax sp. Root217]
MEVRIGLYEPIPKFLHFGSFQHSVDKCVVLKLIQVRKHSIVRLPHSQGPNFGLANGLQEWLSERRNLKQYFLDSVLHSFLQ